MRRSLLLGALLLSLSAQTKKSPIDKFRQLEEILPTPNEYRTASGAPGHKYWQQKTDYSIDVELDDVNQKIIGSAEPTVRGLYGRNLLAASVQTDDSTLATVIQPYGVKPNTCRHRAASALRCSASHATC